MPAGGGGALTAAGSGEQVVPASDRQGYFVFRFRFDARLLKISCSDTPSLHFPASGERYVRQCF